jgi:hypothetical protein
VGLKLGLFWAKILFLSFFLSFFVCFFLFLYLFLPSFLTSGATQQQLKGTKEYNAAHTVGVGLKLGLFWAKILFQIA